ncbi:22180_t:CDS:2, partial [Dentiscutata erythropus]
FDQAYELAKAKEETDINILQKNNDTDINIEGYNLALFLAANLKYENDYSQVQRLLGQFVKV